MAGTHGKAPAVRRRSTTAARRKADMKGFVEAALKLGARGAKVVRPGDVVTGHWVRWKCRFGCGGYGSSLVCPPHSPTPAETRAMLDEYSTAILFETPSGDTKRSRWRWSVKCFSRATTRPSGSAPGRASFAANAPYDKGCRHPEEARPAMEACGIDVFATARRQVSR